MKKNIKEEIIRKTQELIQTQGLKYFSINTLAEELEIQKSNVFYYFNDKEELLMESVKNYKINFFKELKNIKDTIGCVETKIDKYIEIHEAVLKDNGKVCLCAVMASEFPNLSSPMKEEISSFINDNKDWIFNLIYPFSKDKDLKEKSELFINGILGIMIICRAKKESYRFKRDAKLLADILKLY